MNTNQTVYLTDACDKRVSFFEDMHQLETAHWTTLCYPFSLLADEVVGANLIIIEADNGTMLDALETCRYLRSKTKTIILFVSSQDDEESAIEAYEAGADEYIVTPISSALFDAKLEAWQRWTTV